MRSPAARKLLAPFTRHPASVGETYFVHFRHALRFGGQMIAGGACCLVHALLPFLCTRTGSNTVKRLHQQMVVQRRTEAAADRPQNTALSRVDRRPSTDA